METRMIEVSVRGQEISCTVQHPYPRTNTVQYLHVHFDADAIWDPLKKIAVFRRSGTATVAVPLNETMMCEMPPQMMAVPGYSGPVTVHIGLIGVGEDGSRLTTGEVPVTVNPSCYTEGKTPHPPAPDVYEELLRMIREAAENDVEEIRSALDAYFAENPIDVSGKLDKNQGAENAGKLLGIGEDGEVVPVDTADKVTKDDTRPVTAAAVFAAVEKVGPGASITDDGDGNVTIIFSGSVSVTDDGIGNVVIS